MNEYIRLIKYALLQTTIVPSLICDLFVFIYFTRRWRKSINNAPQNHVIVCLLIVNFIQKTTDIPFVLYFLRWNTVPQKTDTFCSIWNIWDYSLGCINSYLITWCCIERHLFIFHSQIMKKKWCLIVFHYIPLMICLIYTPIFYIFAIVFLRTCSNIWNYSFNFCGGACYLNLPFWSTFDWLCNYVVPSLIILLTNFLLFIRIIWQKIKRQRPIRWNRQQRMIIQLILISSLYFIFITPQIVRGIIQVLSSRNFFHDRQYNYFQYISYYMNQMLPFVIIISLPKMCKNFKRSMACMKRFCHGRTQVDPS